VLACLQQRGAQFVVDICQATSLAPGAVRAALWQLVRLGLVTNDRFDPIRHGEQPTDGNISSRSALRRQSMRRAAAPPEGRWSLLPWLQPNMETQAVCSAMLLLQRYGVAARELALLDGRLPPWRVLYEVLSRMEMAGEVRRGYLVEGLSGAQFALPDAVRLLQEATITSTNAPAILLHSLDPANLYGSGAPFDVPLLDGGTRSLLRRMGNWLVMSGGRPVLLIEQQGRKITTLPSASAEQLAAAVARLSDLLRHDRILASRHKLTISEWNNQPVAGSPGQPLLEQLGFVRDYQDMTLYAAWR
jgi:ATP-dependent Lhr-like helicase